MPPRIFISYRRDDAAGEAGRLSDHLIQRFGAPSVFLDIDTIQPGADFVVTLEDSLKETGVMLVVIGRRWLGDGGRRRLDDPADFVRLELERALSRSIPIVPVLVQGATMPQATDLPAPLAALSKRQAVTLDHAEFRHDADRLSDHIAKILGISASAAAPSWRSRRAAGGAVAALALILGAAAYWLADDDGTNPPATPENVRPAATNPRVDAALAEAAAQRQRNQFVEALATLAAARELAPDSDAVRRLQEDVAMDLIRNVRVQQGGTFAAAIKPGLAVIDAALPAAAGTRRADLLAHAGWATFLMRRDGDGRLDPTESYREALKIDPDNPSANAMLAHWMISHDDDLAGGMPLFLKAETDRRAIDAVRQLEWGALGNSSSVATDVERVRVADRMRRAGERLNDRQQSALRGTYYQFSLGGRAERRAELLQALPPDDHLALLSWAFGATTTAGEQPLIRFYEALLHAEAGRTQEAINGLLTLRDELAGSPGSLQDSVTASLRALREDRREQPSAPRPRPRRQPPGG
jgi:hypothetical protein